MKVLTLISLLCIVNLSANELSWVDKQIEAIKPPRVGLKSTYVESLDNPFIFLKKNKPEKEDSKLITRKASSSEINTTDKIVIKKQEKKLYLDAIINKSALINGKWHKLNQNVGGYKLSQVNTTSVLLVKGSKKVLLSTRSINKNLNFKNKPGRNNENN